MDFNPQAKKLQNYYRWHAPIYDATRWSFLFGRSRLIDALPALSSRRRILEVGCGTGRNLNRLSSLYPGAKITGIDLSPTMLQQASHKTASQSPITLLQGQYGRADLSCKSFDLILLSYSITMMGPQIKPVLQQLTDDLSDSGHIAVVDFHRTPLPWFQRWMEANHVTMDGLLLPLLKERYTPIRASVHPAYWGLWSYFLFLGRKA